MRLTTFVNQCDVAKKLRRLQEPARRRKTVGRVRKKRITLNDGQHIPIKTEPRTKNYSTVGAAFDYFLRFELQRRAPHAIPSPWVAQYAIHAVEKWGLARGTHGGSLLGDPFGNIDRGLWANLEALKRGHWIVSEGIPPAGCSAHAIRYRRYHRILRTALRSNRTLLWRPLFGQGTHARADLCGA